jgi:hypothetical protein
VQQIRGSFVSIVAGSLMWLLASQPAAAGEQDFYYGLAYLRAGTQARAEEYLRRYRDAQQDPEIQRSIDRMLPLLRGPLSEEVREYLAGSLEERVLISPNLRTVGTRPVSYGARMFPVFP